MKEGEQPEKPPSYPSPPARRSTTFVEGKSSSLMINGKWLPPKPTTTTRFLLNGSNGDTGLTVST